MIGFDVELTKCALQDYHHEYQEGRSMTKYQASLDEARKLDTSKMKRKDELKTKTWHGIDSCIEND